MNRKDIEKIADLMRKSEREAWEKFKKSDYSRAEWYLGVAWFYEKLRAYLYHEIINLEE